MSLDVACPEAARLILLKEEGIKFVNREEHLEKYIISAQIDTNLKEVQNTPLRYFKWLAKASSFGCELPK